MAIAHSNIKKVVINELGDMVEEVSLKDWDIQEGGLGWNVDVVVDKAKFEKTFGSTARNDLFELEMNLDTLIEQSFPDEPQSSFLTVNIKIDA